MRRVRVYDFFLDRSSFSGKKTKTEEKKRKDENNDIESIAGWRSRIYIYIMTGRLRQDRLSSPDLLRGKYISRLLQTSLAGVKLTTR